MKQFQNKKKIRSKIYSKTVLIILIILSLILVKAVYNIYMKELESRKVMEKTKVKLTELQNRQKKILNETQYLQSDLGLEEEIRSKFSVAKQGEEVIVIVPKEKEIAAPDPTWFESFSAKVKSWF